MEKEFPLEYTLDEEGLKCFDDNDNDISFTDQEEYDGLEL